MTTTSFDFREENGLVICQKLTMAKNNSERLYIHEAQKLKVDAVLFRRYFQDGENIPYKSEPAVCIFNKDDEFFDTEEHIKLHASLWSAGNNEIYLLKGQTRIDAINARKPAEPNTDNKLSVVSLRLMSKAIDQFDYNKFSAYLFASGTFWEQKNFESQLDINKSPYVLLLTYLLKIRNNFLVSQDLELDPATIDKLLVISILIKFLEEQKDDNGKHTLKSIYGKYRINDFSEAITSNFSIAILEELASEFNGKIFDKFTEEEKKKIQKSDLSILSGFLRGNINPISGQYFIWDQYNFKYLPAEVISAIYENFIQEDSKRLTGQTEKGIVYTPIHLVSFLIDEMMPLDKPELFKDEVFKILDPACGSGVFLVAAYKRLLQWWAINNSTNVGIRYPQSKQALKILEENIFGIDIKETATLVSIFGLTTALLDKLTPQEIWNNLKFNDLSQKNIQHNNFFEWAGSVKDKHLSFDLVIGNPPFNPISGLSKKDAVTEAQLSIFELKSKDIPDNNFALKFFEGSMYFGKKVCMIIPSNVILYNKASQSYRTRIFSKYTVNKIFDFTHLRRELFHKTADTPIVVLIVENKISERQPIRHTVIKRMLASEKKIGFEIDYYDSHLVRWDWAVDENKSFIWKTNLLGGGRLFHLIYRLSLLPTLGDYIEKKKKENNWKFNIGYIVGNSNQLKRAPFITNQDYVISIDDKDIVNTQVEVSETFEATREEELYTPPFLLIKDIIGVDNIPVYFIEEYKNKYLAFRRNFTGISASQEDKPLLRNIYEAFSTKYAKLYQLFVILNSASVIIKQETYINKEDIENLPFPEDDKYLNLSITEKILQKDVLDYYIHLGKAIGKTSDGSIFEHIVKKEQLALFGQIFCNALNDIYSNQGKYWQVGNIQHVEQYIIFQFGFGGKGKLASNQFQESKEDLSSLVENTIYNSAAIHKRIVRFYQHENGYDCVYLIKPSTQRYWLNSIALRDADDTFVDLKKAGY